MKGFLSRIQRGKGLKRVMAFVLSFLMVFTMMPGNVLVARAADGDNAVGIFEFQNGTKVEDSNAVSFAIDGKEYVVTLTAFGGTEWGTHNDNAEWRNIPSNSEVTFTLTMPEGETTPPVMMISGARESFALDNGVYSFSRMFDFENGQNFYNIQLQLDGQGQGQGPSGNNNVGTFEFQDGTKVEDSNAISFTIDGKIYVVTLTTLDGAEWGVHDTNAELRNIPNNSEVIFTLAMPEGETTPPVMMISGARESFALNNGVYSFTRMFNFSDAQNFYNIQLQVDGQGQDPNPGPGPDDQPKGLIDIVCQSNRLVGGHIAYKINGASEFSHVGENIEEQVYECIDLNDVEQLNSITIKFEPSQGYQLDVARGVSLFVNRQVRYYGTGNDLQGFLGENGYTFNLEDILTGDETVENSRFELEFGFENSQGGGEHYEPELGVINLLCQDLDEAGTVMYRFGSDEAVEFVEAKNSINIPSDATNVTIKFVVNDPEVFMLDTGRGVSLNVNGDEKYHLSGEAAEGIMEYTFNLAEYVGDKAIEDSAFELSYGFQYIDDSMDKRPRNMLWVYSEEYGQKHHFVDPQGDVDCLVLNGDVDILSINYNEVTYSKDELLELGSKPDGERGDVWYEVDPGNMGYAQIPAGAIVTVKLLPDYGYQVLRAELNGSEIKPAEEQSVFTFTMPTNPLHLSAVFTACKDEVVTSSEEVESGSVLLADDEMEAGSALLTVETADADSESVFDEIMEELDGYEIASCLDIGLQQIFYKGTKDAYWANSKDTLANEATISLSLSEEFETEDVKILHEKHNGEVEIIDATIDEETGAVTFKTDSFSTYAIIKAGDGEDTIGAKLAGYSLSLYDNIGVNFYMELKDAVIKDNAAKMVMTFANGSAKEMFVREANTTEVDGKTCYVFDCQVAAAQMTDVIKAKMVLGDGTEGTEHEFCIQDYAKYILDDSDAKEKDVQVVKAMLNYGAYAQKYFNYNTTKLANSILVDNDKVNLDKLPDLSAYMYQGPKASDTMSFYGTSLVLGSGTKLKFYFNSKDAINIEDITVTSEGKTIDPSRITVGESGALQYVVIHDIYPTDLDTKYTISVNGMIVENASVFGYMQMVFDGNDGNVKLTELMKALYVYASVVD